MSTSTVDFQIEDYTPPAVTNEYDPYVAKLIEAGEGKVGKFTVPVEDETKAKRRFADAANRADKSPKSEGREESADGKTVTLSYRLTKRRTYNRKDDAAEATETGE